MLLLVIARHSDAYGCSWCSQKTLAVETGCCDRTVRTLLKAFENRGLIRRFGRMGPLGGQLSDVVMLTGWPQRKLIPNAGHPRLKTVLKETLETKGDWTLNRAQARKKFPVGPETVADQQKEILNIPTTARLEDALEACFETLGPWATTENRQHLVDDLKTLKKWLEQGIDLNRHILPVLAEKAKNATKIPILRTWRYFENPIGKAASRKRQPMPGSNGHPTARDESQDEPNSLSRPHSEGGGT